MIVHDMKDVDVAKRANSLGIRSGPIGRDRWQGRGWALIVQRERPRTPIRDSMEVTVSLRNSNSVAGE